MHVPRSEYIRLILVQEQHKMHTMLKLIRPVSEGRNDRLFANRFACHPQDE